MYSHLLNNLRQIILIILVSFTYSSLVAQHNFPESWEGSYRGDLQIFGVDSVRMKVDMGLDIVKKTDSVFQFKITYVFRGNEDIRDYELVVVDKSTGNYIIDEKNSILIDSYYKSGYFTSMFQVQDSYIITSYTKLNDTLEFELISASGANITATGNSEVNGETIPEVFSYLVNARQRALLKKMN